MKIITSDVSSHNLIFGLILWLLLIVVSPSHAETADSRHCPDLKNLIPTNQFGIDTSTGVREFRYTHLVLNNGPGPLEIQPFYSSTTGTYLGYQHIYTHDAAGQPNWSIVETHPVASPFEFHAEHGHFHFLYAAFGLYAVATDGSVGAPVALSPKVGFCINDSYLYDYSNGPVDAGTAPAHYGAFAGSWGSCADPTTLRGQTVGSVDEYDYRDPGQSIPIGNLSDGTYWFRAVADPNNYLFECNESNNITDVKVTINNNVVTAGETRYPDSTPPGIRMTSPADGAEVAGTAVTLSADVTNSVKFLIDGKPLGSIGTNSQQWNSTSAPDGPHWLSAQTTNAAGRIGTSPVVQVTVNNSGSQLPTDGLMIDNSFSMDGHGTLSTTVSTSEPGEVLVAFVAADGPSTSTQSATVFGGGMTWTLVRRANGQPGTADIWTANAPGQLTGMLITSTLANPNYGQSLTVMAFKAGTGIGTSMAGGGPNGAPAVTFTSTRAGARAFGVANNYDHPVAPTLAAGQTQQHLWIDSGVGDAYWLQSQTTAAAIAGATISVEDTAPTTDHWNMAAVEVYPLTQTGSDTSPPIVTITEPLGGATVSGIVKVAANAADNSQVASVQFYLDDLPLGQTVTSPPYMTSWDTSTATIGEHTLFARATDTSQNTGESSPVTVMLANSPPPPKPIGKEVTVVKDGSGIIRTHSFSTLTTGDLLVAFITYDGPSNRAQTANVSGARLKWKLVERSNSQPGTSEIWAARATGTLSRVRITAKPARRFYRTRITAKPARRSYHGTLAVIAFTNAAGTGISGAGGSLSGPPTVMLPGIAAGNWPFMVCDNSSRAVAPTPANTQQILHQRLDTSVNKTFWIQSTVAPTTGFNMVELRNTDPTADRWNCAGTEITAQH
ncbi:MAG: Ig-like domain-containing protein [Methylomicrobium sp.]